MAIQRKFFTVTEANRAIPRIAALIENLRQKIQWLRENRQPVSYLVEQFNIVNESPVNGAYFETLLSVRASLKEIQQVGAQVKDIDTGLVDFPAHLHGREVLLCWRLGEAQVRFWHDLESGFNGRQPLFDDQDEPGGAEGEGN